MVLPRKVRDIVLVLALLGLPLVVLQANLKDPGALNPFDRAIMKVSAPVQAFVTSTISGIHAAWRRYVYLVDVEKRSEKLTAENRKLKLELATAKRGLGRLELYEKLLGFRKTRGVETVGVRVVGRDASPFVRLLRVQVDRGRPTLRVGLPVVTAEGVVGRVGRTFGGYSDITLAVDPKSAIDVIIQRTGGRGLLRGLEGTNRYACRIDYLLRKEEVKVGDLVVTSGVAGVFPKDLAVGRVSRVTRRTYGLYQEVEVTPTVDYSALKEMLVILSPPPPPAPKTEGAKEPARGFLP